ncbi:MAG: Na(+)/H(+) antiporter subunit A [Melioribacteraceae bacterium]|nr:MAG: Na(+)/H(+) antiporter subunit A [Melioribacteraceae bacterium]
MKEKASLLLSLVPVFLFAWYLSYYNRVANGEIIKEVSEWIPAMGINLTFSMDGLSLLFALIITGIGSVVFFYAAAYLKHDKYITRFYVYILFFMASMLGVVTSDNIFGLFVFWELTSLSSYLLIGYYFDKESSRKSALQALLVTGTGGLALLAGLILLYIITGTTEISEMLAVTGISSHELYTGAVILVLIGAFTKSAQFPFHFWLPNAMAAPSPVSAYLHSATMVKAGVFLLARLNPVLGGTEFWQNTLLIFGGTTMVIAAFLALKQTDLKKLLAYSTVSVLGTLTFMIGLGTETALKGMVIYLLAHSLFKASLFLIAGSIDHETGTRNVSQLSGLKSFMPFTAFVAIFAALSKMGFFPFYGFIGKETLYDAVLKSGSNEILLFSAVFIGGAVSGFVAITAGIKPFIGRTIETPKSPHEAPLLMYAGPIVLASAGFIFGLLPESFTGNIVEKTASAIAGTNIEYTIKLWHGFNLVFLLSVVTLVVAYLLYRFRTKFTNISIASGVGDFIKPSMLYDKSLSMMISLARGQTRLLQNGYMRYYIVLIVSTALGLTGYVLFTSVDMSVIDISFDITFSEVVILLVMIAASITAIKAKRRLSAIASLGVVGYGVAIIFIMYGAPDLALTQFSIETLTVILFVLAIYRLPKYLPFSNTTLRFRDFIIAAASGVMMTMIVLLVTSEEMVSQLKSFFAENSLPLAKGKNVVNVILVDFRALDTMGEITVLAIAAIGVYALIKLRMEGRK